MITWIGFIGKLVEFTITKLMGRKIELSLDKKKKTAGVFLSLFDSIVSLESLSSSILNDLEHIIKGDRRIIYNIKLSKKNENIYSCSKKFLESLRDVAYISYFYDPMLSVFLSNSMASKAFIINLYSEMEGEYSGHSLISSAFEKMKFDIGWDNTSNSASISYSNPKHDISEYDFERYYKLVSNISEDVEINNINTRNPENFQDGTLLNMINKISYEDSIILSQSDKAHLLHEMISFHLSILSEAREKLRGFIRRSFSIEDLLYVKK